MNTLQAECPYCETVFFRIRDISLHVQFAHPDERADFAAKISQNALKVDDRNFVENPPRDPEEFHFALKWHFGLTNEIDRCRMIRRLERSFPKLAATDRRAFYSVAVAELRQQEMQGAEVGAK